MRDLWLLPAGIEEMMPAEAMRMERLRRSLIDACYGCGYNLVSPPLLEHLDSLLNTGSEDLELETFKLIDHESGRQLGIRADMTPQIARIDAHVLNSNTPTRLCYAGPVLRARTKRSFESRELFQLGAELYGSNSTDADVEVIELMMRCITLSGFKQSNLDIGHVGVFRALTEATGLDRSDEAILFDALQRKSIPDLQRIVSALALDETLASILVSLPDLRGPVALLDASLEKLTAVSPAVAAATDNLRRVVRALVNRGSPFEINFDLSELRGYHYHTGVVFSAFVEGHGREIARGGRYDAIGAVFGRSRAATGFSLDLRQVTKLQTQTGEDIPGCILAPSISDDDALNSLVQELRTLGERVVQRLGSASDETPACCDRELICGDSGWTIIPRSSGA